MNLIKKISLACTLLVSTLSFGQSVNCADMGPICTDAGLDFTAQTGVAAASVTDPSNAYGCLSSSPNPTWYYLEISTSGDLVMSLSAASDIDFIIYGPYADLATAQGDCGSMSTADIVDCSYSGTNNETPEIGANSTGGATSAVLGEVYVMLITNYANNVQDVTLSQTSGSGSTDCSIVQPDPCVSNPGTAVRTKNGVLTALPLYLCEGDNFSIVSNGDYILPNDTIAAPIGDYAGVAGETTTAQLMWLVYDGVPDGLNDPLNDPNFLGNGAIIPSDDIVGSNSATDPLFQALGGVCGTYYFVPVAGDDGDASQFNSGVAGSGDNSGLHWDKDGNGCFVFGDPVEVTFACPMDVTPTINCGGAIGNGMDITITGGSGNYTIVNQGEGNLVNVNVNNGGTAQISGLTNNQGWEIDITDAAGCLSNASGIFGAPTIANITINPAASCPVGTNGDVEVTIGASGQGPYVVGMNEFPIVVGSPYVYAGPAGTAVSTLVTDANGCVFDSIVTITSAGHFINTAIVSQTDEECSGDGNGSATITAMAVNSAGVQDGNILTIEWTDPLGGPISGGPSNTSQTGMMVGNWFVTVTDDTGCEVTFPVVIGGPQDLSVSVFESSDITCFDGNDGDITLESNGGVGNTTFSWNANNPVAPASPNATTANQLTAGLYWMYVTDANGCMDSVSIELEQPDEITAWFTLKDVVCYGESTGAIIIDSVTNNAGNVSYIWNLVTQPNPPVTSNLASNLPIGTYQFKVVDENFCENQYTITIEQNDSIFWDELGFDSSICRNQIPFDNGKGQVFAAAARWAPGVGGSNFTYLWTEDATGNTTTNTTWGNRNPGFYTIVATDNHGCELSETIYLDSISPVSNFTIEFAQGTPQCVGPAIEVPDFINNSTNYAFSEDPNADTTFVWSFSVEGGDTTIFINHDASEVVNHPYSAEGLYTVCLTVIENLNGCEDSTCQTIQIFDCPKLDIPNVFTPGGDDVNNTFFFPNVAIVEFECTVYDRWGKEVFKFNDINTEWDGTNNSNGKDCSDGVYFYVYSGDSSNGTHYEGQGNVHLIRK